MSETKVAWYVYRHTAPDGRKYIGITKKNPAERWLNGSGYSSNLAFWTYICDVGWDNIKHEIIAICYTERDARLVEASLILFEGTLWPRGFNLTCSVIPDEPNDIIDVDCAKFAKLYQEYKHGERPIGYVRNQLGVNKAEYRRLCKEYENRTGRFEGWGA